MSIQQRLLQREPLDPWSVREQLCLASAVCRSGDQNWMSVSRALRASGDTTRPQDWYQQKYCAAQYGALLESAETPKRKKRASEGAVETPQEAILKRLTAERIAELQKSMQDCKSQYAVLKDEIAEVRSPATSESRLKELLAGLEASRRQKERETQRQAQWLRDRDERRRNVDKRRASNTAAGALSPPASSPLLTSLLKSSSPGAGAASVAHMLLLPHPSTVVDPVSPSASAPTLSMLLERGREAGVPAPPAPPAPSDAAVIEQIKSELQEIENNLRLGNIPPSTPTVLPPVLPVLHKPAAPVEIDDIEIKAEDVYAFSDMDLEIQPVSTIHKPVTSTRIAEKQTDKNEECEESINVDVVSLDVPNEETVQIKDEVVEVPSVQEELVPVRAESPPKPVEEENVVVNVEQDIPAVIPESEKTVEETPESDRVAEKEINEQAEPVEDTSVEEPSVCDTEEEVNVTGVSDALDSQEESEVAEQTEIEIEAVPSPKEATVKEEETPTEEKKEEAEEETPVSPAPCTPPRKEEEESPRAAEGAPAEEKPSEAEETHTETDDDTPMEVIREEEKVGRKRRDYSRKKAQQADGRGGWNSESAAESAPESPAARPGLDPERDRRLWRKSVLLVYNRLCAHKYASLFLRPITDELAPDYSLVVRRPMDLTTIKRNIDSGLIRTTAEFQRDVLLMLSNALLYNSSQHRVHHMAQDMHQEAVAQLGMLLQAQAHSGLDSHEPVSRRRERDKQGERKRAGSPRRVSTASPPAKRLRSD